MDPTLANQPDGMPIGPYTWEDFVALDDDDPRELIDGYLIEVEVPTQLHEFIVAALTIAIGSWAKQGRKGIVLTSGYKIQITPRRGVMPDVQFYRTGRLPKSAQQGLVGSYPDLAIEVISPSSRGMDNVAKLNSYAKIGVPEYWIVDPEARTLQRFMLQSGRYVIEAHGGSEVFAPDAFPGLEISLAELWDLPDVELSR